MYERFTERARQVVVLAQDEARGLKHNYIGSEHLLLGLIREEEGIAARTLRSLDVEGDHVRRRVFEIVGEGDVALTGQLPFTPRARKILDLGLREALSLGHNYVGTEHILLGLAREGEGIAARILEECYATADKVRNEVIRQLTPRSPATATATAPTLTFRVNGSKPLRDALTQIAAMLGPTAGCAHNKCEGCQAEMAEALRIAQEALA